MDERSSSIIFEISAAFAFINGRGDGYFHQCIPKLINDNSRDGPFWIARCMTPTEIHIVVSNGARLIKIIPGNLVPPDFSFAVEKRFPDLVFLSIGGFELNTATIITWFKRRLLQSCNWQQAKEGIMKKRLATFDSKYFISNVDCLKNTRFF